MLDRLELGDRPPELRAVEGILDRLFEDLFERAGHLLGNPVHYRDHRTEGMLEETFRRIPREEIYERTGVQFIPINTLYQLMALVTSGDPQLEVADRLLTMPALRLTVCWLS